jgi:hypothetical protein
VVERGPEKAGVGGSIPSLATTLEDNRTFLILEGRLEVVRVAALHEHFGCEIGRPKRVSSPASAFSENFDDLCEALAAVLPVSLEASLHAIGVASNNCADHLIVLRHRKVEILDDRAGIQPPIAFCLRGPAPDSMMARWRSRSRSKIPAAREGLAATISRN